MNTIEYDVMNALIERPYESQRILAKRCNYSLGIINQSLKKLNQNGFLDEKNQFTIKALKHIDNKKPKNAIILAAGFGMRMVPINTEMPKGLIEVRNEPLIERIIKQLHEVGIYEIYIVVGFMKEQFEYLIDEYNVELIVNREYSSKNNMHSLKFALNHLSNSYIVPCDIWCSENPFNKNELYSWYMVSDKEDKNSSVRVNRKKELVTIKNGTLGNSMIGICYLLDDDSKIIRDKILELSNNSRYNDSFWEETLFDKDKMIVSARVVNQEKYIEINTYEQLREIDSNSNQLKSETLEVIGRVLNIPIDDISNIQVIKKGMTNRSFLFSCGDSKYIMRLPGEGTDLLINRKEEADVYKVLEKTNISDDVIYINCDNGYKISKYIENTRVCDPNNYNDLSLCMKKLKEFHLLNLKVNHEFDIFKQINFYESLWDGKKSVYRDYEMTKQNVFSLKEYIDRHVETKTLTHIDAVPDNFLFTKDNEVLLIDWEYAGMQDPHVDIAMFSIYALYDRKQVDTLIDIYFEGKCKEETRIKIYSYIAACGLLWSNWCEYKRNLGVEFGEYSIRQYRYAKEFYKIVIQEWKE